MKLFTTIIFVFSAISFSHAQSDYDYEPDLPKTVFGIKTGVNVSELSKPFGGDVKPRIGLNLGGYARIAITEEAFFRPEIYYSSQGQENVYKLSGTSTMMKIDYLNVPLILEYGNRFSLQLGFQIGILLNAKAESGNQRADFKDLMRPTDTSVLLGFGASPVKHFTTGIRYNAGLNDLFRDDERYQTPTGLSSAPPSVFNRVLHFYVGYSF